MAEPSSPQPQRAAPRSNARIVAVSGPEEILSERTWQALIIASTAAVLLFSAYCLSHGITVVFMHLYYFPIVLLAYRYRYRGFAPATLLAIAYVGLVYFYDAGQANIITEAWYRFIVFIGIAAVIAYLSEQLASAQKATWEACELRERYLTLAPAIVIALDSRGAITYLNEQGCTVLGCRPEEVIGRSWSDLFVPEKDRDRAKEIFRQILDGQSGPDRAVDNPVLTSSGAEKIFRWHYTVLHDEDGAIAGTLGFGEEVTGQIQAEEKIRKLQQFQESVITNANVWITVLDPWGNILLWNDAAEAISGYPKSEVLGAATVWKRLYPDRKYRGKVTGDIRRIIERDNYLENFETEIRCGDSSKKAIVWNTRGLKDTQGTVTSYIAIGRDITAQKTAEEEARRSSELYREFFTTSRDCVFITSPQGQWIDFNESALEMFGYGTREELARVPMTQLYHKAEDRGEFLDYIGTEGYAKEYPMQLQRRDGTVIDTLITTEPIRNADGSVRAYVGTIRDITERKRAEEALLKASKKISMLSSITRHDIRNQLMALRTYIELLKESVKDAELLGFITMEDSIAEAISTQIEFTKYYEDIGVNAPKWQDIPELILSAKSQLREYEHIDVGIEVPPVQVYADALIEKVFYNILENSVRHGVHVTRVFFSFRETGDGALIIYGDNGAGISPEDKPHLFEKGYGRHTGLGLFLSREILAITGLTIRENGDPGKGVRFEIAVPKEAYRYPGGAEGPA
jgi:PAS domain S-box-containing protein